MTYIIVKGSSLSDLVGEVNRCIPQGYEPIGGIMYAEGFYTWCFAQAMIKRTKQ